MPLRKKKIGEGLLLNPTVVAAGAKKKGKLDLLGVGRRECRKIDRRADIAPGKEPTDNRSLPATDRWHDANNRSAGYETRRDSKWSLRWGSDDKEKGFSSGEKDRYG